MKRTAVATVVREAAGERTVELRAVQPAPGTDPASAVDALRRRLAGSTAREHVVLDFLEDDLREARGALAGVIAFLDGVESALGDPAPSPERLLSLARSIQPAEQVDYLQTVLASVRRRLSQVATRM
jgi:hypothetical protein